MKSKNSVLERRSFTITGSSLIALTVCLPLGLLLSACGSAATPQPQPAESVISEVQTVVALTLTAQPTPSTTPTAAPSPTFMPTLYFPPTEIPATPTSQQYYSYLPYDTNYGCEDAAYVKDVTIPDETILTPDEIFVKTWKLKNTGSCTWNPDFHLVFVGGNNMGGANPEINTVVATNKKDDVSITLIAPESEGSYVGYWRLADDYGNTFGDEVNVQIIVLAATSTPLPTLTVTPLPTFTVTPMPTSIATTTSTPTIVSTDTPTPIPSATPIPTFTGSPTPVVTSTSTLASSPTPTLVPSYTPTPVPTIVPGTPIPTPTLTITYTPIPTGVSTYVPTPTPTP